MNKETKQNIEQKELDDFLQNRIVEIIEGNYSKFAGTNEAALHASEDIVDLINETFKPVQPEEVKSLPSAEEVLDNICIECEGDNLEDLIWRGDLNWKELQQIYIKAMKSYKTLCVEQERKVWEKEKEYLQNKIHKYEHPFDHFLKNRSK